jgi:phytoene synthase
MDPDSGDIELSPPERLAVLYAPRAAQVLWEGFLLLDRRLADAAREGRDPLMIQLRLAWWRDRFDQPSSAWPQGEPLLALLRAWDAERAALRGLVDGWEARTVGEDGGAELGKARVDAICALALLSGVRPDDVVRRAAAEWLGLEPAGAGAPILSGKLRPLVILRGMALRDAAGRPGGPVRDFLAILRLGLFGR